jgi:hypothetical protein
MAFTIRIMVDKTNHSFQEGTTIKDLKTLLTTVTVTITTTAIATNIDKHFD